MQKPRKPQGHADSRSDRTRKDYSAPRIVHESEMETRAGSPLFAGDPSQWRNPWDPGYGASAGQ